MSIDSLFKNQIKPAIPEGKDFVVWLSHDVDRVQKSIAHCLYYFLKDKRPYHLQTIISKKNPYWNFEYIMELESKYGAKSTFFFLNESIKPDLMKPKSFILSKGRYKISNSEITSVIKEIDRSGWEVGLHGSFNSYLDKKLLMHEKNVLEDILGHSIKSVRQHYFNNSIPQTWEIQRSIGLKYDATFVKKNDVGFYKDVYYPFRPFDDDFTVIPTVIMDGYLLDKAKNRETAEKIIDEIIEQCGEKGAILNTLWHQRIVNPKEFPLLYGLYEYLLRAVQEKNGGFILLAEVL